MQCALKDDPPQACPIPQAPNLEMALPLHSPLTSSSQAHPSSRINPPYSRLFLPSKPLPYLTCAHILAPLYLFNYQNHSNLTRREKQAGLVLLKIQPGHQALSPHWLLWACFSLCEISHRIWLRILSIALEEELKVLDCLMTTLLLFSLLCFPLFLHFSFL